MTGHHQDDPERRPEKMAKRSKKWMSEWKEITRSAQQDTESEARESSDQHKNAITPDNGWYSLFFGKDEIILVPSAKSRRKESRNKKSHNLAIGGPPQVLQVHKDEQLVQEIPLPIFSQHDGIAVTSSRVGVLLFLEADTSLTVVENHNTDSQSNQWRVGFHGFLDKNKRDNPPTNGTLAWNATDFKVKRCFVCSLCGQSFFDVKSVQQHQLVRHAADLSERNNSATTNSDDEDEIWKRPLYCLYQDDALLVIDKPQGMAVMGADRTLQRSDLLMPFKGTRIPNWPTTETQSPPKQDSNEEEKSGVEDTILGKPRPVHRLDGITGGVLVVAKTKRCERRFRELFESRECHKTYHAIVYGKLKEPGICEIPLSGKPCKTEYRPQRYGRTVISRDEWLTVVELSPVTGRYHQLRRHLQFLKHPIVGDPRYGGGPFQLEGKEVEKPKHLKRLCLWAVKIEFSHPVTDKTTIVELPKEPEWLGFVLAEEAKRWESKLKD